MSEMLHIGNDADGREWWVNPDVVESVRIQAPVYRPGHVFAYEHGGWGFPTRREPRAVPPRVEPGGVTVVIGGEEHALYDAIAEGLAPLLPPSMVEAIEAWREREAWARSRVAEEFPVWEQKKQEAWEAWEESQADPQEPGESEPGGWRPWRRR